VLADFVEGSPGYEEPHGEFLKEAPDYVVVECHDQARSGIALLKSEGAGRSTFFVTRMPNGNGNDHTHTGAFGQNDYAGKSADSSSPCPETESPQSDNQPRNGSHGNGNSGDLEGNGTISGAEGRMTPLKNL